MGNSLLGATACHGQQLICHGQQPVRGRQRLSAKPGAATAATLLPGNDPNFVDGPFETHWNRLPRQSARWALFGRRRSGSSGNGTGSSRRSSRGQPTQESILGPISITIYISMNNGDSDAMDKRNILRHCTGSMTKNTVQFSKAKAKTTLLGCTPHTDTRTGSMTSCVVYSAITTHFTVGLTVGRRVSP